MSKTEEKTLLSQNWAHKMFYVILPAYFKELQKYQNLQFLVKTSPKITFYIVREYYIITIYIFTMEIYHNMQYEINGWLLHRFMRTPLGVLTSRHHFRSIGNSPFYIKFSGNISQNTFLTKADLCFDCDWLRKARWVVSSRIAASPSVIIEKRAQAFSR